MKKVRNNMKAKTKHDVKVLMKDNRFSNFEKRKRI